MPQLLMELSAVSQPLGRLVSQSPKPLEHDGAHVEPTQLTLPCALVHGLVQLPQCAALVASVTSQPLLTVPSQSP
jgi:hypothetical protein